MESIIFRNIFICVEGLNYIKNYMKTRREARRGGRPSPHFQLLRNRTEHLYYTRRRRSAKHERFIKIFLKRDQDLLNSKFFCENKTALFSSFRFFSIYYVFTEEFHSLLCFHHSQYVGRIQTSFFLDNHPTMTVKMWKFLFQKSKKHPQVLSK